MNRTQATATDTNQGQDVDLRNLPNDESSQVQEQPPSDRDSASESEEIPDGGYGWVVVFACFIHTFWINAWTASWGILQLALLKQTLQHSSSSTVSFIGSLGMALGPGLGAPSVQIARLIGARNTSLIGIIFFGVGCIISGEAVSSVGALFITSGFMYGIAAGLMYAMCNTLPIQWFSTKLGTANGIIKLGGGVGATVMAVATGLLTEKVGIAWTFRILGFLSLGTGIPAAFLIQEKKTGRRSYALDWSVFKHSPFSWLFISGAFGVFALYTPSFFLPYIADALGLSNTASTGIIACFNACMAVGRLVSGVACDKLGTMNMLFLTMALNTITMFAVWSVSNTMAILLVFAITNGIANGSFFVTMPTAVGRIWTGNKAGGAISIALTGWFPGLLVGSPIAGALIDAMGAEKATSIVPFRPVVFYSGGTALVSTAFYLLARQAMKKTTASRIESSH